jgi:hypothetical protein
VQRAVSVVVVSVAVAAIACARTSPVYAPVEVNVAAAPPPPAGRRVGSNGDEKRCTARLVALDIETGEGCFLDERISKGDGILTYPCAGDGVVEATFGEHRFDGDVVKGAVALSLTTELDWDEDHCRWQSQQEIRGEIGKHELAWRYVDRPIRGEHCNMPCSARAIIEIDPGGPGDAARPRRAPADEDIDVDD